MEEIVQKLDELICAINNNSEQRWLTWVGILVPIAVSIIAIVIDIILNIRNKKLQKQIMESEEVFQKKISDRDIKTQMHSDFLKIYDDFCYARNIIGSGLNNIENFCIDTNNMNRWLNDLWESVQRTAQATNRARLLVPADDVDLPNILSYIWHQAEFLWQLTFNYVYSNDTIQLYYQLWDRVSLQYGIPKGNINALRSNSIAYSEFIMYYRNSTTIEINDMIGNILPLFEYEKFDKYFEQYIKMER